MDQVKYYIIIDIHLFPHSQCLQFSLLPVDLCILSLHLYQKPSSVILSTKMWAESIPFHTVTSIPYSQYLQLFLLPAKLKSCFSEFHALSLNLAILLLKVGILGLHYYL